MTDMQQMAGFVRPSDVRGESNFMESSLYSPSAPLALSYAPRMPCVPLPLLSPHPKGESIILRGISFNMVRIVSCKKLTVCSKLGAAVDLARRPQSNAVKCIMFSAHQRSAAPCLCHGFTVNTRSAGLTIAHKRVDLQARIRPHGKAVAPRGHEATTRQRQLPSPTLTPGEPYLLLGITAT